MAGQQQVPEAPRQPKPVSTRAEEGRWDLVDESSWESFPASDSPSWATPSTDTADVRPSRPSESESPGGAQRSGGEHRGLHPP
jgi:hypothetical protein